MSACLMVCLLQVLYWGCISSRLWDCNNTISLTIWHISWYKYHDTIHDVIHLWYTTDRQRRAAKNGWTMCFVRGCARVCQLTINWNCAWFCAAILKDTWLEAHKAIQRWNSFSLSQVPLNSSERAWTWVRSHKRQLFLNVEFFHMTWITIS